MQQVRPKALRLIAGKNRTTGALWAAAKPKLLDRMREAMRSRHYSRSTERRYCQWVKRFIFFDNVLMPAVGVCGAPSTRYEWGVMMSVT